MAFHQPGSLLVSHVSLSLSPILAPTLFLGKMMKRENRGLGEENEKEYFFSFLGFLSNMICAFSIVWLNL